MLRPVRGTAGRRRERVSKRLASRGGCGSAVLVLGEVLRRTPARAGRAAKSLRSEPLSPRGSEILLALRVPAVPRLQPACRGRSLGCPVMV